MSLCRTTRCVRSLSRCVWQEQLFLRRPSISQKQPKCWSLLYASTSTTSTVIPPAANIHVPHDDDRYHGYSDALFGEQEEYTTPLPCDVTGEIPDWLQGSFIRVGPGRFKWGNTEVGHWFDGDAIAHRFSIKNGNVTYQNKFLRTEYRRKNEKYNRISRSGFGTWAPPDPCANIFRRLAMYFVPSFEPSDNAGVNVFDIQGKTYVVTETPWMVEIDKETLDTIKLINARSKIPSPTSTWLAHPHIEEDGTTLIFNTIQGPNPRYELIAIPPTPGPDPLEGIKVITTLKCGPQGAGYYHSFATTENYIILVENPLFLDSVFKLLTSNITRKSIQDALAFKPEVGTIFRIIDKKTGKELRQCIADAFFVVHHANAFERDGELVLDMSAYPDHSIISQFYMHNIRNEFRGLTVKPPNLVRYRLPLSELISHESEPHRIESSKEGKDYEVLSPNVEGCIVNYPMCNGKPYKYVFGVNDFVYRARLVKVDVDTKVSTYWTPPDNAVPSIPHFIPNPRGASEDDGLLVTNCNGTNGTKSFFVILDAKTMKEVGRADMPVDAVFGIHANFFEH